MRGDPIAGSGTIRRDRCHAPPAFAPLPMPFVIALLAAAAFLLLKCTGGHDDTRSARDEAVEVGVFFEFPPGASPAGPQAPRLIGTATGATACEAAARAYAKKQNLSGSSGWNYHCCTHENGSDCHRRIR